MQVILVFNSQVGVKFYLALECLKIKHELILKKEIKWQVELGCDINFEGVMLVTVDEKQWLRLFSFFSDCSIL